MDLKEVPPKRPAPGVTDQAPVDPKPDLPAVPASSPMAWLSAAAAIAVAATGLLVLAGWAFSIEPLTGEIYKFPSMKANSAAAFLLAGVSLWLHRKNSPQLQRGARILGLLVALVGVATLLQYVFDTSLGIDELLFRDGKAAFTSHPGRMSSNTAAAFVLAGSALAVLPSALAGWLALLSLVPVLMTVAGYLHGAVRFIGLLSYTGMAPHTILMFVVLASGIIAALPTSGLGLWAASSGPEGTIVRRLLPASVLVVAGIDLLTQLGLTAGYYNEYSRDALSMASAIAGICVLCLVVARTVAQVDAERRQAAQEVQKSEQRYRSLYENNLDPVFSVGPDGRFVSANSAALAVSGYALHELLALHFLEVCAPEQREAAAHAFREGLCRRCRDLETVIIDKAGRRRDLFITGAPVIVDGEIVGVSCIGRDITERKRADAMMRSRLRLSELARSTAMEELIQYGLDEAESFTGSSIGYFHFVDEDQETISLQAWSSNTLRSMCTAEGKGVHYPISQAGIWVDCVHAAAPVIHNDYQSEPHRKGLPSGHAPVVRDLALPVLRDDRVVAIIGVGNKATDYSQADIDVLQDFASLLIDLVERKRTEDTLRDNELFYRQTLDSIPGMVFTTRPDGYCDYQSQRWVDFTGVPMSEHLGDGWNRLLHPDDRPRAYAAWCDAVEGRAPYDLEYRVRRHDGAYEWFKVRGRPIRNQAGEIVRWFGTALNIDDLVKAEEELRKANEQLETRVGDRTRELADTVAALQEEITRRQQTQDQLLQSQKMETVGRLAGGIAHDFNNLLMVMYGFAEEATESTADPAVRESLQHVLSAGSKAKELAHKLLAFSRQHVMEKHRINLGTVVDDMLRLLKRIIAENIDVGLSLPADPLTVDADQGQIEQVVTNIVLNARDAMPGGGRLNLSVYGTAVEDESTALGIEPGEYAVVEVTDTGTGIDEGDIGRIFDPFFSTKEMGKGTGLGLSIAYGIVKQHAGAIAVESSPGNGSTFKVFLPLVKAMPEEVREARTVVNRAGKGALLLVEDDPTVRLYLRLILQRGGYTIIEAEDGAEALLAAENHDFSLLITDMLMPRMNGMELHAALKETRPGINCIVISGYSSDLLQDTLPPDVVFLQKPVARDDLLRTVDSLLSQL